MADYPESVADIVSKAVQKHKDDIDRAVEFVKGRVALLPEYPELIDALMYVIGEGIVKQNGEGPYRKRYDEAKVTFAAGHPDYSKGRCHSHAMLLASKLLLKNLWIQMRTEA